MRLVFARASAGTPVTTAAELQAALDAKLAPTAALTEIVEIRFGTHVLDRAAIRAIVLAYHDWPQRNALRATYGLADYEAVLRVVVAGYGAQLARQFGIEPRELFAAIDGSELRVGVRGLFGDLVVDWNAGVFSRSTITSYPARPAPVAKTLDTVITSERGDYYSVTGLGTAQFRSRDDDPASNAKVHHGAVLRTYREPAEFVDANGARFASDLELARPTPYVIARPGGLPRTGLRNTIHLVRLELDDSGLGGSRPIIESVTVLDGTPAFPAELEAAHRALWQRHYTPDLRAAELATAADEKSALVAFDARTAAWAKQVQPSQPIEASERRYTHDTPTYRWDAAAKTLDVTFAHETHVVHLKTIRYPNPALATFHCPPGVPCAVPPETLSHELELEYVRAFNATYRIASDGHITRTAPTQPRLSIAR